MNRYICPVCKKTLSKTEYEKALGIWEKRKEHIEHEERKLKEREKQILKQRETLKGREKQLDKKEKEIYQNAKAKAKKDVEIQFKKSEKKLKKQALLIKEKEERTRARSLQLQARQNTIKTREMQLNKKAKTIYRQTRNKALQEAETMLKRKEKTIQKKAAIEAKQAEKEKTKRLLAGRDEEIKKLRDRMRQLEERKEPREEGLEFEERLTNVLKQVFKQDDIKHTGKNGDVVHRIRENNKEIGLIVYECKRVPKILSDHIEQARRAKAALEADFAVLVTSGKKKGFDGLSQEKNVFIVAPNGAIPIATLLRQYIVEINRLQLTKEKRSKVAEYLMKYISSSHFKNPIQNVIQRTNDLEEMLKKEANDHFRAWDRRWKHYQIMRWDTTHIQNNLNLILDSKKPQPYLPEKPKPLPLPGK